MRFHWTSCAGLLAAVLLFSAPSCISHQQAFDAVDPFVGTGFHGHTYPGATTPFGLVQLSPDTRNTTWDGCSGYHYSDSLILGFSHTHLSGTGCGDLGDFLFTPGLLATDGNAQALPAPLPFSHGDEQAEPGYYRVAFPVDGITVELTATPHVGVHRYHFDEPGTPALLVDMRYGIGGDAVHVHELRFECPDKHTVEGFRQLGCWSPYRVMAFSARFSSPVTACRDLGDGRWLLLFPKDISVLTAWVGLSGVDEEGARTNLLAETTEGTTAAETVTALMDFDTLRRRARSVWEEALSVISVEGGTAAQRSVFYTALYHTMLAPNRMDDCDGRYRRHWTTLSRQQDGGHFYSTLSLWDTFRAWNPLQTLINHKLVADMIDSMLDMYEMEGRLPVWPLGAGETGCMIGYHSIPVIADAWLRGLRTFDGEKALEAMVVSSNRDDASEVYNQYGYVPSDLKGQSVSRTLEFAYDDWCIARMAESLGKKSIAAEYDARARRYRAVYDPSTGFFRGRRSDGSFVTPFHTEAFSFDFTEGLPWQYRFFVPHDIEGHFELMGGRERAYEALDSLFTFSVRDASASHISDMTGMVGQYAHGNEPSHHMAYLFNWLGDSRRSQMEVRRLLDTMYAPAPDGICGNEDCGQMSAWYILSALGIYPVCPGSGDYVFAAPLFRKARVTLGNGKTLTIEADHPEYPCIASVSFNGEPVSGFNISWERLMQGGTLSFRLRGATPDDGGKQHLPSPFER